MNRCRVCQLSLGAGLPYCKVHWPWLNQEEVEKLHLEVFRARQSAALWKKVAKDYRKRNAFAWGRVNHWYEEWYREAGLGETSLWYEIKRLLFGWLR